MFPIPRSDDSNRRPGGGGRCRSGPDLPPVTADNTDGGPTLVAVGTEDGPVLASLVIGGRYRPDTGGVFLDGRDDTDALRTAVALVDTPGVAEPAPSLPLGSVVREELVFAGLASGRAAVRQFLHRFGLSRVK